MPQHGTPFLAFIVYTFALSVILTFLALKTRVYVFVATLFHGTVNTFGLVNSAVPTLRGSSNALRKAFASRLTMLICNRAKYIVSFNPSA